MKHITNTLLLSALMALVLVLPLQAQVGNKAKPFSLKDVRSGKFHNLSTYQSYKCLVLVFTSVYCPYSKYYQERIKQLAQKYQETDATVHFVMVNASPDRDSPEEMKAAAEDYDLDYLIDQDLQLAKQLGASKMPEVFVLAKQLDEHFVIKYHGAIDDSPQMAEDVKHNYLANAIESVLAGRVSREAAQAPIGCKIRLE